MAAESGVVGDLNVSGSRLSSTANLVRIYRPASLASTASGPPCVVYLGVGHLHRGEGELNVRKTKMEAWAKFRAQRAERRAKLLAKRLASARNGSRAGRRQRSRGGRSSGSKSRWRGGEGSGGAGRGGEGSGRGSVGRGSGGQGRQLSEQAKAGALNARRVRHRTAACPSGGWEATVARKATHPSSSTAASPERQAKWNARYAADRSRQDISVPLSVLASPSPLYSICIARRSPCPSPCLWRSQASCALSSYCLLDALPVLGAHPALDSCPSPVPPPAHSSSAIATPTSSTPSPRSHHTGCYRARPSSASHLLR